MTTSSITTARTPQLSAYFTQLRIDHRTIVRDSRCHGTKFCGVELQQQQRAVATNGGMDSDWLEGQRPEARGPVVLRAAAAAVAGGEFLEYTVFAPLAPQALETGDFGIVEPIL